MLDSAAYRDTACNNYMIIIRFCRPKLTLIPYRGATLRIDAIENTVYPIVAQRRRGNCEPMITSLALPARYAVFDQVCAS